MEFTFVWLYWPWYWIEQCKEQIARAEFRFKISQNVRLCCRNVEYGIGMEILS